LGFVTIEGRGSKDAQYYYLCTYDPKTKNVRKHYLGPVGSAEARRKADFYRWINILDERKVKRLRDESMAAKRLGLSFYDSLERVLELGESSR